MAGLLRTHIMQGLFPPGTRLSEEAIGQALEVSRNTLREAFRLLCHERLAAHHLNRGIFVPVLSSQDVIDLYSLRRLVEGGAARRAGSASMDARLAVMAIVEEAEKAAAAVSDRRCVPLTCVSAKQWRPWPAVLVSMSSCGGHWRKCA